MSMKKTAKLQQQSCCYVAKTLGINYKKCAGYCRIAKYMMFLDIDKDYHLLKLIYYCHKLGVSILEVRDTRSISADILHKLQNPDLYSSTLLDASSGVFVCCKLRAAV